MSAANAQPETDEYIINRKWFYSSSRSVARHASDMLRSSFSSRSTSCSLGIVLRDFQKLSFSSLLLFLLTCNN